MQGEEEEGVDPDLSLGMSGSGPLSWYPMLRVSGINNEQVSF